MGDEIYSIDLSRKRDPVTLAPFFDREKAIAESVKYAASEQG